MSFGASLERRSSKRHTEIVDQFVIAVNQWIVGRRRDRLHVEETDHGHVGGEGEAARVPVTRETALPLIGPKPLFRAAVKEGVERVDALELCGSDDRVTTSDPAVGRFVFFDASSNMVAKCTAWIASSGAYLSAGHCFHRTDYGDPDLLEFNVPLSDADGSPNFADPDDQYPIDLTNWVRHDNGTGDDYSIFDCNVNSDTGYLPVQGQNDFFRTAKVADITTPATIRITGYGVDDGTVNRVLQTDTGPYVGQNGSGSSVSVEYQVDTMSGNSGGPVIVYGSETSIGVHTNAGCDPPTGNGNHGTSFENDALESALDDFFGTNVRYVDAYHPIASALENGTVLRPYDTVSEAVAVASSGNRIRIVNGTYSSAADSSLLLGADGKSLLLLAPVGSVTIGP